MTTEDLIASPVLIWGSTGHLCIPSSNLSSMLLATLSSVLQPVMTAPIMDFVGFCVQGDQLVLGGEAAPAWQPAIPWWTPTPTWHTARLPPAPWRFRGEPALELELVSASLFT